MTDQKRHDEESLLRDYVAKLEKSEKARMNHRSLEHLEDAGAELVMIDLLLTELHGRVTTIALHLLNARNPIKEATA